MPVFGEKKQGVQYVERRAVYGVILDESGKLGVIRRTYDQLLFLPGGGMEPSESELECLDREVMEETGCTVMNPVFLCKGTQFFQSRDASQYIQNIGSFYSCSVGIKKTDPLEEDYELIWITPDEAASRLFHQHQAWAVRQWIEQD